MNIASDMPVIALEEVWGLARDGLPLLFRHWPANGSKASLVLVHGYAEHSGRYGHVATALNRTGVDVFSLDLRGHGRSGGRRGHIRWFREYLDDVDLLVKRADRNRVGKRFILGHSLGGLVVCNYVIERQPECHGVVVCCPFLGMALPVPRYKIPLAHILTTVAPAFSLPTGLPPSLLSHDPAVQRAYAADPLVFHRATARWFTECLRAMRETFENAGRFCLPCLFLQAGDDRIADPKAPRRLYDAVASTDKSYREYPGFYHEILNEVGKETVLGDLLAWITERI